MAIFLIVLVAVGLKAGVVEVLEIPENRRVEKRGIIECIQYSSRDAPFILRHRL